MSESKIDRRTDADAKMDADRITRAAKRTDWAGSALEGRPSSSRVSPMTSRASGALRTLASPTTRRSAEVETPARADVGSPRLDPLPPHTGLRTRVEPQSAERYDAARTSPVGTYQRSKAPWVRGGS